MAAIRRFRVLIGGIGLLVLAYGCAGFLLVPQLARSALGKQLGVDGRTVTIERLRFNPFLLRMQVEGFALAEGGGARLLGFRALIVKAAPLSSVWNRGLVLRAVRLEGPDVSVVRERDGSLNLARLLPQPAAEPRPAAGAPPRIRIGSLIVEDGRLDIRDLSRPEVFETRLSPIRFALEDFRTDAAYDNLYQFSAKAESGERLDWSGEFSLRPLASSGRFQLRDLQAATVESYLQNQLPVRLLSGVAALEGRYRLQMDPEPGLEVELPTLTLERLALGEAGASQAAGTPPVSIAALKVADVSLSLARRVASVGSVEIEGARLGVQREADGSLSLSRLLPRKPPVKVVPPNAALPPAPAAPGSKAAPAVWQVRVAAVKLAAAAVVLDDRAVTPATHFELDPVNLQVDGYTSAAAAKLRITGDVLLDRNARLTVAGDLRPTPVEATLDLDLKGLPLVPLQPYLTPHTGLQLRAGVLGGTLRLHYLAGSGPGAPGTLALAGALGVDGFVSQDPAQQDFLKWRRLGIEGLDYRQAPAKLSIDAITLDAPYARVTVEPDRTLNLAQVISPPGAARPAPAPPAGTAAKPAPMAIRIGAVTLRNGSANFADRSIEPQFAAGINGLAGTVTGLSSAPGSRARLHFEGNVDRYSPVLIDGVANPLAAKRYLDLALDFRNMDLTTFNPYSGRFAGYDIVKGKLTTELRYRIDDRKLDARHHVVIDQLEFGDATGSKQAVPLPVRLAASLLKDRNGVIDIDLPVTGSLDDPSFSLGPIVWKVFLNLLTKVVTEPFAAIGSLFGGGAELSYIDFAPGSAALDEDAGAKLDKLAAALVERPQLRLDVPLTFVESQDRAALAKARLAMLLPAEAAGTPAREHLKALERIYRAQVGKAPDYPDASGSRDEVAAVRSAGLEATLLDRLAPDADQLRQLAKARADSVQARILANTQISPERIFVTDGRDAKTREDGAARMELRLE